MTYVNAIALALDVAPSTFLGILGTAYAKANALPRADSRAAQLLRVAGRSRQAATASPAGSPTARVPQRTVAVSR